MSDTPAPRSRRWMLYAPLGLAAAAGAGFWVMLRGLQTGDYNPRGVPSALLGRPVPDFALPPLEAANLPTLAAADLRGPLPAPVVVNFWASWCVPCIVEHPQLMRLSREGIRVLGDLGNPYRSIGVDEAGRTAIDWGVYGVPETYLLDRQGLIRWRFAGPITPDVLDQDLRPLLRRYA